MRNPFPALVCAGVLCAAVWAMRGEEAPAAGGQEEVAPLKAKVKELDKKIGALRKEIAATDGMKALLQKADDAAKALEDAKKTYLEALEATLAADPQATPLIRERNELQARLRAAELGKVIHTETPKYGMPLSYYAPKSCADKERTPLVLSYHGKGGANEGEIGAWVGLAEKHGFVVACPKSYFAGGVRPADDKRPLGPMREIEDALVVVEMLNDRFRIDERFILATGFSGGGLPAYTAGLLNPKVFRYVCSRSGNFPDQLIAAAQQQAGTQPRIAENIDSALKENHFCFFFGEKDHPIILNLDGPMQTRFFENRKAAHFKKETIKGMGHDSRPDLAAEWFVAEIKAALAPPEASDAKKP